MYAQETQTKGENSPKQTQRTKNDECGVRQRGEKQSWKESVHPAGPRGRASSGGSIITLTSTACRGRLPEETETAKNRLQLLQTQQHTNTHYCGTPTAPGTYLLADNKRCEYDMIRDIYIYIHTACEPSHTGVHT